MEELVASSEALGALTYEGEVGTIKRSIIHRYRYDPEQEHKFREGRRRPSIPRPAIRLERSTRSTPAQGSIDLARGRTTPAPHPKALIPEGPRTTKVLREALRRVAEGILANGIDGTGSYPRHAISPASSATH
jgi:hypothetical protein